MSGEKKFLVNKSIINSSLKTLRERQSDREREAERRRETAV
jgi:hypothetical protein